MPIPLPPPPPAIVLKVEVPPPIDLMRLMFCIEEKEQGSWDHHGGKACWTADAWFETCRLPFYYSESPTSSRANGVLRLAWFVTRFVEKGVNPTPYLLACAWNKGFDWTIRHFRLPAENRLPYGVHVTNLYLDPTNILYTDALIP